MPAGSESFSWSRDTATSIALGLIEGRAQYHNLAITVEFPRSGFGKRRKPNRGFEPPWDRGYVTTFQLRGADCRKPLTQQFTLQDATGARVFVEDRGIAHAMHDYQRTTMGGRRFFGRIACRPPHNIKTVSTDAFWCRRH